MKLSVVSDANLRFLQFAARACTALPGEFAELGVYRGGSARVIAEAAPSKMLHLFDTFTGIPAELARPDLDAHVPGDFADVVLTDVLETMRGCRIDLRPGLFPATTQGLADEVFALVHIDADLYQSVRDGLEFFWPRLVPGGCVILDDYGAPKCRGCNMAADEFAAQHGFTWQPVAQHGVYALKP